ncbi:MAG: hypothetical protein Q8K93_05825 [Reyranella sp.]|nr:hypothetical protein [Reyranella sp.]
MDRLHIYNTRTLVAVEFASSPSSLAGIARQAHTFRRLDLAESLALNGKAVRSAASPVAAEQMTRLMEVLKGRIDFWEKLVPAGLKCFVHLVRFNDEASGRAGYAQAVAAFPGFAMIGLYAVDPTISIFPQAFPLDPAPNMWQPGRRNEASKDSLFFFNFFPQQPALYGFVVQGTLAIYSESAPGLYHTNNYVDLVSDQFISAGTVDKVVAVNLNRYQDGNGFFRAVAAGAAKSVIVDGHERFQWHGMLTRLVEAG